MEWISVEDDLPEDYTYVLVASEGGNVDLFIKALEKAKEVWCD